MKQLKIFLKSSDGSQIQYTISMRRKQCINDLNFLFENIRKLPDLKVYDAKEWDTAPLGN